MRKEVEKRKLKGRIDVVMDDTNVMGILEEISCEDEFFSGYKEFPVDGFKLFIDKSSWGDKKHNNYVLGHPDLTYRFSPYLLGSVLRYMQRNFNEAHILADKEKPMPFMVRARRLKERYEGPAFMVAPVIPGTYKKTAEGTYKRV